MKDGPILFNGDMVLAIMDGRKSQTRRVVKDGTEWGTPEDLNDLSELGLSQMRYCCPSGKIGGRLWVRESWKLWEDPEDGHDFVIYRAGGKKSFPNIEHLDLPLDPFADRWRPSIHMFRWMSRITLEITDIRVEKLNDISLSDVNSEGIGSTTFIDTWNGRHHFSILWDSISAKSYPWSSNPWVWVVEFKKI